jgi:HNH endonuclease
MEKSNPQLTVEYLRECFDLNHETGQLIWKVRPWGHFADDKTWWLFNQHFPGRVVRALPDRKGYLRFKLHVEGQVWRLYVARVVFALVHGRWPKWTVDHWDRDHANNRPTNLKEATFSEQGQNAVSQPNKTGYRGVVKIRRGWRAQIKVDGKRHYKGPFKTAEQASAAYLAMKAEYHPYQPEVPQ